MSIILYFTWTLFGNVTYLIKPFFLIWLKEMNLVICSLMPKKGKKPPVKIWLRSHVLCSHGCVSNIWLMINTWWTRSLNLMSTNDFRGRLLLWKSTYLRTLAIWIFYFYNPLFLRFLPILSQSGNLEKKFLNKTLSNYIFQIT